MKHFRAPIVGLLLTGVLDVPLEFLRDGLLNGLEAIGTWPVQLLLALR